VRYIYSKRIYKEKDMEALLRQIIQLNRSFLPEQEITELFKSVKNELEE
jgi:hypothetical protein